MAVRRPRRDLDEALDLTRPIAGVATAITAFVGRAEQGPVDTPVHLTGFAEFEGTFGGLVSRCGLGFAVRDFFANGGTDAVVVRLFEPGPVGVPEGAPLTASDIVGRGLKAAGAGLHALDREDGFNLLVIAPDPPERPIDPVVVREAEAYCLERRAILLLDGPPDWKSADDVLAASAVGLDAVMGTSGANAALYFPRLLEPNPLNGNEIEAFSTLGAAAGVIARTDARAGVWRSPAGRDAVLDKVHALEVDLTSSEVSALTAVGVNCLRSIPGGGPVVWGARTMQGADSAASEWKYLSVRRTALFIEESVARGTRWVVFEPNAEPTWASVRERVDEFLYGLFRAGAFPASRRPSDAYFVSCGPDTMTRAEIDSGVLTVLVGFAPIRPAEFVVVRIHQTTGPSS